MCLKRGAHCQHAQDAESVLQHTGAIDSDYNGLGPSLRASHIACLEPVADGVSPLARGKATQIALKHGEAEPSGEQPAYLANFSRTLTNMGWRGRKFRPQNDVHRVSLSEKS